MKTKLTPFVSDRLGSFTEGEIHILLGEDAADNLHFSLAQTAMLLASRKFKRIVYFNFPFSRRRFTEAKQSIFGEHGEAIGKLIDYYHLATGRMSERLHALKDKLDKPEQTALIINSWELASPNYRYREELIFALRELQMELGVTVFVFGVTRKPSAVKARRLNHAGLGKLSLAADSVVSLIEEENSKEARGASVPLATQPEAPLTPPASGRDTIYGVSTMSKDEEDLDDIDAKLEATREPKKQKSENLSDSNFNDLTHPNEHLSAVEEEELEYA